MLKLVLVLVIVATVGFADGEISGGCLSCICSVEGCNGQIGKCRQDAGSLSCGPYQIKYAYWVDCGRPEGDYQTCTKQKACSERCIRAYMNRYATRCTGGRTPTCQDYARVHNGGPRGCRYSSTVRYWNRVNSCCGGSC